MMKVHEWSEPLLHSNKNSFWTLFLESTAGQLVNRQLLKLKIFTKAKSLVQLVAK